MSEARDKNGNVIKVLDSISHTDQRVGWRTVKEIISSDRVRFASHGYGTEEGHDLTTYWTIVARDGRPFDSAAEAEKGKGNRVDPASRAASALWYPDGPSVQTGDWYECCGARRQVLAIGAGRYGVAIVRCERRDEMDVETFRGCTLLRRGVVGERYEEPKLASRNNGHNVAEIKLKDGASLSDALTIGADPGPQGAAFIPRNTNYWEPGEANYEESRVINPGPTPDIWPLATELESLTESKVVRLHGEKPWSMASRPTGIVERAAVLVRGNEFRVLTISGGPHNAQNLRSAIIALSKVLWAKPEPKGPGAPQNKPFSEWEREFLGPMERAVDPSDLKTPRST